MSLKHCIPLYPYLAGLSTYVPGLHNFAPVDPPESDVYSLSVFVQHLSNYINYQPRKVLPKVIIELGPGSTVGFGLAAMLLYESDYISLDIDSFFDSDVNLTVLDRIYHRLLEGSFVPDNISADFLPKSNRALQLRDIQALDLSTTTITDRYNLIRSRIQEPLPFPSKERWATPLLPKEMYTIFLSSRPVPNPVCVDGIFSQAVLEHVDDLHDLFFNLLSVVAPRALHSHLVDFSCHGLTREWNGHWKFSDSQWRIIRGRRPQFINRATDSNLLTFFRSLGFHLIHHEQYRNTNRPSIDEHRSRIRSSSSDFSAESSYFLFG